MVILTESDRKEVLWDTGAPVSLVGRDCMGKYTKIYEISEYNLNTERCW